jgi:hypothetical protein
VQRQRRTPGELLGDDDQYDRRSRAKRE